MKELDEIIHNIEALRNALERKNAPKSKTLEDFLTEEDFLTDGLNRSDGDEDSSIDTKQENGIEFKCLADGLTFKEATIYVLARTKIYDVMITTPLLFEHMLGIIYPMFKNTKEVLFPLERNHLLLGLKSKTLIPSKLDIASLEGNDYCVLDTTKFLQTLIKGK